MTNQNNICESAKLLNIAIDGGAGTGKGTLAKPLAELLGYKVLDAGAMYRAATKFFYDTGIEPKEVANHLNIIENLSYDGKLPSVNGIIYNDSDIRTEKISNLTPDYGKSPHFKRMIIEFQQEITGQSKGWVGEGRNMAFDVMYESGDISFYLHADPLVRALRRWRERKWPDGKFPSVYQEIVERDEKDYRHNPPLMRPEEAKESYNHFIDTTPRTISQNFEVILGHVMAKGVNVNQGLLKKIVQELDEKDPHHQH